MYPQRRLNDLAEARALVQRRIATRRAQCSHLAAEIALPFHRFEQWRTRLRPFRVLFTLLPLASWFVRSRMRHRTRRFFPWVMLWRIAMALRSLRKP